MQEAPRGGACVNECPPGSDGKIKGRGSLKTKIKSCRKPFHFHPCPEAISHVEDNNIDSFI